MKYMNEETNAYIIECYVGSLQGQRDLHHVAACGLGRLQLGHGLNRNKNAAAVVVDALQGVVELAAKLGAVEAPRVDVVGLQLREQVCVVGRVQEVAERLRGNRRQDPRDGLAKGVDILVPLRLNSGDQSVADAKSLLGTTHVELDVEALGLHKHVGTLTVPAVPDCPLELRHALPECRNLLVCKGSLPILAFPSPPRQCHHRQGFGIGDQVLQVRDLFLCSYFVL